MTDAVRFAWLARIFGQVLALYVRLVASTSRFRGSITMDQVVLTFWHEYNLAALAILLMRRRTIPHASFSTRGFRGAVINTVLAELGVRIISLPAEGTDRAEARSLALRLAGLAAEGYSLAVTPDGPFGPYRTAKPGVAILARASGLPIVPLAFDPRPGLRLRRRWDRHLVPLPFCRLRVVEGAPVILAPRRRIAPALVELQGELDRLAALAGRAGRA